MTDELYHEYRRYLSDHPGHPLGRGMPMGRSMRIEVFHEPTQMWRGESHSMWWQRVLRADPCSFCGEVIHYSFRADEWRHGAGTVDHVEPKSQPIRGIGGAHAWTNLAGACSDCNGSKSDKPLLMFLHQHRDRVAARERRLALVPTEEAAA